MGGILFHSGYYLGDDLFPPRESNPLGFFETDMINEINEQILLPFDYNKLHPEQTEAGGIQSPYSPVYGQRWLSFIEPKTRIDCDRADVIPKIKSVCSRAPFAYKDPRFSYTLPVWLDFLPTDTVYICMFRHPGKTVRSVFGERKTADYLQQFHIDTEVAYQLWYNCYERILRQLVSLLGDRLIFIHYEQLLTGSVIPVIAERLGHTLRTSFIANELNRSQADEEVPESVLSIYQECLLHAGYQEN
jgi:hypothetical protein